MRGYRGLWSDSSSGGGQSDDGGIKRSREVALEDSELNRTDRSDISHGGGRGGGGDSDDDVAKSRRIEDDRKRGLGDTDSDRDIENEESDELYISGSGVGGGATKQKRARVASSTDGIVASASVTDAYTAPKVMTNQRIVAKSDSKPRGETVRTGKSPGKRIASPPPPVANVPLMREGERGVVCEQEGGSRGEIALPGKVQAGGSTSTVPMPRSLQRLVMTSTSDTSSALKTDRTGSSLHRRPHLSTKVRSARSTHTHIHISKLYI